MTNSPSTAGRQDGVVLVMVLWALVVLGVVAAGVAASLRTDLRVAGNIVENAKAEALADAGVHLAVLGLRHADPAMRWTADGKPRSFRLGEGQVLVRVEDEAGKVDLNGASDELLRGLLVAAGVAEEDAAGLVDRIADFRDEDSLRRANGAEDADYRAAGLPHGAKDGAFERVDELGQVLGMPPELARRLRPYLTVFTHQRGVDPSVASPAVLRALPGVDAGLAEEIAGNGAAAPAQAIRYISRSRHDTFTVRAQGRTEGGGVFEREAVLRLTHDPYRPFVVHLWRRGSSAAVITHR